MSKFFDQKVVKKKKKTGKNQKNLHKSLIHQKSNLTIKPLYLNETSPTSIFLLGKIKRNILPLHQHSTEDFSNYGDFTFIFSYRIMWLIIFPTKHCYIWSQFLPQRVVPWRLWKYQARQETHGGKTVWCHCPGRKRQTTVRMVHQWKSVTVKEIWIKKKTLLTFFKHTIRSACLRVCTCQQFF